MEDGRIAPTPEPMTPDERRAAARTEGSGFSNFVVTDGSPIEHEDFPTRQSVPQLHTTRRGTPRQVVDDALDEVIPKEDQTPKHEARTEEEVAKQQAINSRGRPKAGVGAAEAKRKSLEASFEKGEIDELTLNALKQKYSLK